MASAAVRPTTLFQLPEVSTLCAICSEPNSKFCTNCKKTRYCDQHCQRLDRPTHKLICFPAIEQEGQGIRFQNSRNGNYWIATREIKQGEVIFLDSPLYVGPMKKDLSNVHFTCLGCHKVFGIGDASPCKDCEWPLCSSSCPMIQRHTAQECVVFMKTREIGSMDFREFINTVRGYDIVRELRCLLLSLNNKPAWQEFMTLPVDKWGTPALTDVHEAEFYHLCGFRYLEPQVILDAIKIQETLSSPTVCHTTRCELFLLSKGCRIDFDCVPNTISFEVQVKNGGWTRTNVTRFIATVRIKPGERLTQSPLLNNGTKGTKLRRQEIFNAYHIHCNCERCRDPTELYTNLSAVKCEGCERGYMLPLDPLDVNSDWKCNFANCGQTVEASRIDEGIALATQELEGLEAEVSAAGVGRLIHPIAEISLEEYFVLNKLEKYIVKYERRLHPNHYLNLQVKNHLLAGLGYIFSAPRMPCIAVAFREDRIRLLTRMRELAESCTKIGNTILPGLSIYRGKTQYYHAMSKFCMVQELAVTGGDAATIVELQNDGTRLQENVETIFKHLSAPAAEAGLPYRLGRFKRFVQQICDYSPLYSSHPLAEEEDDGLSMEMNAMMTISSGDEDEDPEGIDA